VEDSRDSRRAKEREREREREHWDICRRVLKNVLSPEKAAPVPASAARSCPLRPPLLRLLVPSRRPSSTAPNWPPLRAPLPCNPCFLPAC